MVDALLSDLAMVEAGALVLFTSREQMRQAVDALPTVMRETVLVQNTLPRQQLLSRHRERVAQGMPSIIFGMQSFGEGLDLPGPLCESLFITKLPFAPPDDPVGEARAEWLRGSGRDPFIELVVPATAIRLAQWAGRAIRTEEDRAHVYCYDKRLVRTSYGQLLLKGLPPFTLERRTAAG
ncbi:putative ATP-dependent helicase DinG [bioreactor metagenome]|uniref:Putative ATP-dependent helicase DinG n=1 Tax=bioreactor metagenome TaxID=1076179 RepID=A0A645D2L6_9ZZZZ